jgi:acyl-CoA reductase-like NAD-dependent aldehyde dehydrogenase
MLAREKFLIGAEWIVPSVRETINVHNARTGAIMGRIPARGEKEIEAAVAAAASISRS